MNHFAEILRVEDRDEIHESDNKIISEIIDEIETVDCFKNSNYSDLRYRKVANMSLAFGLMIVPCDVDSVLINNKYNTQVQSERLITCDNFWGRFSVLEEETILSEEEEVAIASTYSEDFNRVPSKETFTIKTKVNAVMKGRPSRL